MEWAGHGHVWKKRYRKIEWQSKGWEVEAETCLACSRDSVWLGDSVWLTRCDRGTEERGKRQMKSWAYPAARQCKLWTTVESLPFILSEMGSCRKLWSDFNIRSVISAVVCCVNYLGVSR